MADHLFSSRRVREAQRTGRVVDEEEKHWLVYELPPSHDRRSSPSLVFESDTAIRRIREFPGNWRELSDEELIALSWTK